MRNVYVLEPCKSGVLGAEQFGNVEYLFDRDGCRPSIWAPDFGDAVAGELERRGYDHRRDAFVVAGPQVPVAMAALALLAHWPSANLLYWNATDRNYVLRRIERAERSSSAARHREDGAREHLQEPEANTRR